jgi:hypothetical protein
LIKVVKNLESKYGVTALGPSLLVSSLIAAEQGGPGSEILVCTDGLANHGIGSFIRRDNNGNVLELSEEQKIEVKKQAS